MLLSLMVLTRLYYKAAVITLGVIGDVSATVWVYGVAKCLLVGSTRILFGLCNCLPLANAPIAAAHTHLACLIFAMNTLVICASREPSWLLTKLQ